MIMKIEIDIEILPFNSTETLFPIALLDYQVFWHPSIRFEQFTFAKLTAAN